MTRAELMEFLRAHRLAVEATADPNGAVEAAVIGIAVSDTFEIVFDTLSTSRKARNLEHNARIALVVGGVLEGEERTVQIEGNADRPSGTERERLQQLYLEVFPDGRERLAWPDLVYVRVTPTWLRSSDYRSQPPAIVELNATELRELR